MQLTQDILNNIFTYKDGELYWKTKINRQTKVGTRAGSISGSGYWQTWVYNKKYLNHRLIFMMFNNSVPDCLDHIDRNPLNNKIENLRSATRTENQYNKKTPKHSISGIKGVYKYKDSWRARLIADKKRINLGYFKTVEEATMAVQKARQELHQEFFNHGI